MTDETEPLDVEESPNDWECEPPRSHRALDRLGSAAVVLGEILLAAAAGYALGYILGVVLGRTGTAQ